MLPDKFTYPFCYVPHPLVKAAALSVIGRIDASPQLRAMFAEGKMLGTLICSDKDGSQVTLYAFSGLAGGRSEVEGFVPPIYDLTAPDGYFKRREAEISAMPAGPAKSLASAGLQEWIFRQYVVLNARGERQSILDIFAEEVWCLRAGQGSAPPPNCSSMPISMASSLWRWGSSGMAHPRAGKCVNTDAFIPHAQANAVHCLHG